VALAPFPLPNFSGIWPGDFSDGGGSAGDLPFFPSGGICGKGGAGVLMEGAGVAIKAKKKNVENWGLAKNIVARAGFGRKKFGGNVTGPGIFFTGAT